MRYLLLVDRFYALSLLGKGNVRCHQWWHGRRSHAGVLHRSRDVAHNTPRRPRDAPEGPHAPAFWGLGHAAFSQVTHTVTQCPKAGVYRVPTPCACALDTLRTGVQPTWVLGLAGERLPSASAPTGPGLQRASCPFQLAASRQRLRIKMVLWLSNTRIHARLVITTQMAWPGSNARHARAKPSM